MKNRLTVIDIGTNSVLLTIVERNKDLIRPLLEDAKITRIGEGLADSNIFKPAAIRRTMRVLKEYKGLSGKYKTEKIIAVGTAAMRKAENAEEFIDLTKEKLGIDIEVISGEEEAELNFKATEVDFGHNLIVVDVGGGSTEIIRPAKGDKIEKISLPFGAVTLHEKFAKSDPLSETDYKKMVEYIGRNVPVLCHRKEPANAGEVVIPQTDLNLTLKMVATAGTATTLAAMKLKLKEYNHSEVHGSILDRKDIEQIIGELKGLTIAQRKHLPGLEPKRADVILPGALVLQVILTRSGLPDLTVSDHGVRWGIIRKYFDTKD